MIYLPTFASLTLGLLVTSIPPRRRSPRFKPMRCTCRAERERKTLFPNLSGRNEHRMFGSNGGLNCYTYDNCKVDDKTLSVSSVAKSETSRRCILQRLTTATSISLSVALGPLDFPKAIAISPEEVIQQGASQLPGYGQPDVYYPRAFTGVWRVTRTSERGETVTFQVRFIKLSDDRVVADRAYNELSYQTSLKPSSIQSVDWDTKHPNVLHVTFSNGTWKEVKVTKRSYQTGTTTDGLETFTASELRRITYTDDPNRNTIPIIEGSRLITKWKWEVNPGFPTVNVIEGIELFLPTGELGDPMISPGPKTISRLSSSKSYLYMERIQ